MSAPSMTRRSRVGLLVLAVTAALLYQPGRVLAFPEETETQGEIDVDLNGVWLVVHHLEFDRPEGTKPPEGGDPDKRYFNVLNVFKGTHLKKDEAKKVRDSREAKLQASIAKAKEIAAGKATDEIPVQTAEGEVEGGARVVVPQIPRPPGYDPSIHAGDKVEVLLLDVELPKTIDDALQAAQKVERKYEPSDKELALLGSSWSELERNTDSEFSRIEWKVIAPNHYEPSVQADPQMRDTKLQISGVQGMIPRPGQPNRNIVVYGIREASDGVMSGTHSRAMMATAPFPVPIEMDGNVKMFKIGDVSKPASNTTENGKKEEQPAS